ncbi:hypothetical protein DXG01_013134 [Tephrocybe rancida]|nr:hypothetical protein DXG01_013134 [Tephrocybe rancida]
MVGIDSSVHQVASGLAQTQPAFAVSASKINVMKEPAEFYALLLVDTIRKTLAQKPSVHLHLQLDLNRSTRPGASSTAKILLPLVEEFPDRVNVSMFRSPHLRGLLARFVPPRFNEGWGTWHAKIYGVDDEVIISGANLNKSYFTNRQDRYIHFAKQPRLAQYCFSFLRAISTFSYKLSINPGPAPHSYQQEGYFLDWPDPQTHPHEIHEKAQSALATFQSSQRAAHEASVEQDMLSLNNKADSDSVVLFPVIQAGQFNVREEESALVLLFRSLNGQVAMGHQPLIDLTSGYFGLYEPYQKLVLSSDVSTRVIAASPKANGFYGSKGISGRIPAGYTLLEQRFMSAVKKAGRLWKVGAGVQLTEWERDGWTYHAKGLPFSPKCNTNLNVPPGIWLSPSPTSPPVLTLFGSTNLNSRSAHIDTELSFIMIVPSSPDTLAKGSPKLGEGVASSTLAIRSQLLDEIQGLRMHTIDWMGGQRKVSFWTRVLVRIVKGML